MSSSFIRDVFRTLFGLSLTIACIIRPSFAEELLADKLMPEMADAVAQAVQYSDSMMEAVFQLGRAEADADIRAARTYPVVNGFSQYHGQWEQRDEVSGTQFSRRFLYGLTLRKPIYHWVALEANKRIGEILLQSANKNLDTRRHFVRSECLRRLLYLSIAERESQFAESTLDFRKQLLEQSETGQAEGVATLQELETARMNQRNAYQASLGARNHYRNARHKFLKDFSVSEEVLAKLPEELPKAELDLIKWRERIDVFQKKTYRNHPEYTAAADAVKVQENQILIDRARNRPTIDLVVGANQDDTTHLLTELDDRFRQIYFGGVRVSWNIFDGYETRGRVELARTLRDQALNKKKRLAHKLSQDALQLLHEFENCQARMNAGKEMFDWKAERFRKAERSLELGQISETELAHHGYDFAYEEYQAVLENARCLALILQAELLTTLGQPRKKPVQ